MKPTARLRSYLVACGSLLAISYTQAATLYWDGNDTTANADGGAGSWNTSSTNWDTAAMAGTNATWSNVTPDTAVFGGTAGTVTLGENITTGGLRFDTTGYTINAGANTLSFGATNNSILLNNIAAATITGQLGGSGNVTLSASNPLLAGTLTLNGTSTGGWTGTTTIGAGTTLALAASNQALLNTSGITLNGGGITLTNINNTEGALDRVAAVGITSNGGTITYTNTATGTAYAEALGTVALTTGQLNIVSTNAVNVGGTQTLTLGAGSLTHAASNTSAITFSGASLGLNDRNSIIVTGEADSAVGGIIGPWATWGTTAAAQTDYATYNITGGVSNAFGIQNANIAATAENSASWTAGGNNVTLSGATTLTGTRTLNSLRYTGTAQILGLGASTFNLETYGLLNGGTGTLTVSTTGTGALTTPTGGGHLYLTTGASAITVNSPINDNGGAVTVVKSGSNTLTLGSITSNYSGGTVINAGTLATTLDTNLGTGGGITVNGIATWNMGGASLVTYNRSLTINDGAVLTVTSGNASKTVTGVLSGNGSIIGAGTTGYIFNNANNTFTGTVNNGYQMIFASLGDSSNAINLNGSNSEFQWTGGTKTFALRPFTIQAAGIGNINNNSTGTGALTIQQDLAITGAAGARTLNLGGTNIGDNTFSGSLADGSSGGTSVVTLNKTGAGKWIISGNNSHTGGTTLSAGTLVIGSANALPASGTLIVAGGTLDSTVGTLTSGRFAATGGTISASLGGSKGFIKFGTGTTAFNGTSNDFTGGVTVAGGTLNVAASSALGQNVSGNSILIRDGGILNLAAASNSGSNQAITLSSSAKSGAPVSATAGGAGPTGRLAVLGLAFNGLPNGTISQANSNGGVIAINAVTGYNTDLSTLLSGKNLFLGAIGTSTFTGAAGTVAAGNGSLYRLGGGGGTITFNTTDLFTGGNGVQVGSTFLNGGGTVVLSAAQDYTGATTVSQGTMTLSGAAGSATGSSGFTPNGGRLLLDNATNNSDRIGNSAAVTLSNGGELSLTGNSAGTTEAFGNLNLGAGYSIVTATASTTASTLAGTGFSRTDNGTALFRGTALGQNTTVMGKVTLTDTSGLSFSAGTTLDNAANNDATKDVRIIPYLIGDTASSTGNTFVTYDTTHGFRVLNTTNQFNTTVTANTNVRLAAAQTAIGTNSINSLIIANTGSSTIADGATLTVASGALLFSSAGTIAPAGTTGILNFGAAEGVVTTVAAGVISARIDGSGGLTKSGTGQLTLSNATNSFTGGVVINGGTLVAAADANLGNAANTLTFNGHSAWGGGATFARSVILNNGAVLTLNGNVTISNNVTGTGGLAQNNGFGVQNFFTGTGNAFEGPILIGSTGTTGQAYRMQFASLEDSASANGRIVFVASSVTHAEGSVFEYTGSTNLALNNRQIELASLTASPTSGHQLRSNGVGTLSVGTDLIVSTSIAQTLNLRGSNTGANTFSGKIGDGDGTVSLLKADAGRWILTNANTYSGTTTISAGTLQLGDGGSGNDGTIASSPRIVNNAALVYNRFGSTSYGGAISGTGSVTKTGVGIQILTGANTYTGATTINGGTLAVNGAGSINTTSGITVGVGGTFAYNSSTTLTKAPTLNGAGTSNRAVLGGTGSIGVVVTLDNLGDTLSPGNSPGIMPFATGQTWNSFSYDWELNDWSAAVAGTNFDQITIAGALNLSGGINSYMLNILSLTGANAAGDVSNFAESNKSWTILTTTGGISSFDAANWTVNPAGFTNNDLGSWSLSQSGNDLVLSYTAIPEPSAAALLGGLGALLLLRRRR